MIDDMREIEVVVAHSERVTLRVGDVFLKIDTDQARIDREVEVMARAPIPTPEVLWRKPPVLALAAVPGAALGVLEEPSRASSAAWVAAGAAVRTLHDAPLPPWPSSQCQQQPALSSRGTVEFPPLLDSECEWLVANDVVSADVVRRNRQVAEAALRPWTPVFIHGDLQIVHVFVDGDEVSGVVDWSEGGQGDAMYDLATLTLAHEEHLDDVVAGYGGDIEIDVIRAYWSLRSLMEIRWLVEHGYGAPATFPEVAVLNSLPGAGYGRDGVAEHRRRRGGDGHLVTDAKGGAGRADRAPDAEQAAAFDDAAELAREGRRLGAPSVALQHLGRLAVTIAGGLVDLGDLAARPGGCRPQLGVTDGEGPPGVLLPRRGVAHHEVGPKPIHAKRFGRPFAQPRQ